MEHICNANDSLQRYIEVLENTGYYPHKDVVELLLYCFIVDQVFEGPLSEYLDDEGLTAFNRAIRCISTNNCLIDSISTTVTLSQVRKWHPTRNFRQSESDTQRITEDDFTRRTEQRVE